MVSFPMPFPRVPCKVWLPKYGEPDPYGNRLPTFTEEPDIETECAYAPGRSRPETEDDIEDGRPHGTRTTLTFYLPKTVDADLHGARIACYPADDSTLSGQLFDVVGNPYSYQRGATPGDFSWSVEGVEHRG